MLLGSPPDMVRGHPLRETGSAAVCGGIQLPDYFTIPLRNYQGQIALLSKKDKKSILTPKGIVVYYTVQRRYGGVAQLGERTVRIRKVESSILFVSTMKKS